MALSHLASDSRYWGTVAVTSCFEQSQHLFFQQIYIEFIPGAGNTVQKKDKSLSLWSFWPSARTTNKCNVSICQVVIKLWRKKKKETEI